MLAKLPKKYLIIGFALLIVWVWAPIFFNSPERQANKAYGQYEEQIQQRQQRVANSIQQLSIQDANLLKCITRSSEDRARIHPNSSGGIDSIAELSLLYCPNMGILSLEGISGLRDLKVLDVSKNHISDIGPATSLNKLKTFNFSANPVEDLRGLSKMSSLKKVVLPKYPNESCADLKAMLGSLRSNIKQSACQKETTGAANDNSEQDDDFTWPSPASISTKEEQDLLRYEYDIERELD
ncbi:leucine-rich repeat domain-containing protein [Agaribacterium sp. ZY112]|uniref:leucine-rich repeat domain-containing protein n=1 Tax=Agaribacterium sp. ZY112 TaxID=3233574 RepID=UPI0035231EDE